jgi:hypothetical protein
MRTSKLKGTKTGRVIMCTRVFSAVLAVVFFFSCSRPAPDLTEDEVYGILNEIIVEDSLIAYDVCSKFTDIPFDDAYSKGFSKKDIKFMNRQKELFGNLQIKSNKLKRFNLYSRTFDFATVNTACGSSDGPYCYISFPLISIDRQKVIIEIRQNSGFSSGSGAKYLYNKKKGRWIKIERFDFWMTYNEKNGDKIINEIQNTYPYPYYLLEKPI